MTIIHDKPHECTVGSLLELNDETDVPLWLATAHEQDYGAQLEALEVRWRTLTWRNASACADLLIGRNSHEPRASTALFPVVSKQNCGALLDALMTELWKFYLQGLGSGKANGMQLNRVRQLMGQAALLQAVVAADLGRIEPARLAAADAPILRLPAAFEQHMRGKCHAVESETDR
jgi:hypothetical protein